MKRTAALDSFLILILGSILIWPLFRLNYMDNWPSIESTFIADARMLNNNLPHPGWQPLWYTGTRFDYIYPPALRYGTALIAKLGGTSTARAYHLYTAIFYVLGFLAIYWLVRIASRSRIAALFTTAGVALLSPSFRFIGALRVDSGFNVPQRLHVLMAYGEGPHITALCILPAALAACWIALRKHNLPAIAIAAMLCALTVANNFYGATALAVFFPILFWSIWNGERDSRILLRAASIVALSAGLCAFWLTPSYFSITLLNLKWVSQPGNAKSTLAAILIAAMFLFATRRFAGKRPDREWTVFVTGAALFFTLDVLGFYKLGFRIMGEPARLVPEMDLAIILALVELTRHVWRKPMWRSGIAVLLILGSAPALRYLRNAWTPFPKASPLESEYTYQTTKWLHDNVPGERVLPTGELRFWFNAWFDTPQLDGGSMQGMLNQNLPAATWQIMAGEKPELAVAWLRAFGTSVIAVPQAGSREHYKDYVHPEKYRGVLPVLYENSDTTIYRIARVHPDIGRIVDTNAIRNAPPIRGGDDQERLNQYLSIVEEPTQPPVTVNWRDFDHVDLHAGTHANQTILLQETFDPYWQAEENGKPLAIRKEPTLGFMLIDAPAGDHTIHMTFTTPLENRAGQILFVLSAGIVVFLLTRKERQP